jgi:hypothetical protein
LLSRTAKTTTRKTGFKSKKRIYNRKLNYIKKESQIIGEGKGINNN